MFRKMIRQNKAINLEEIEHLLISERRGVLSLIGDNGYPYGIPINYLFSKEDNKIYFHGSKVGHKVDSLKKCDKVCFTIYGNEMIKEEKWAPYLSSVVIFGRCRMIEKQSEITKILEIFARKYYPNKELILEEITKSKNAVCMFEIEIEHVSGKQIQEK